MQLPQQAGQVATGYRGVDVMVLGASGFIGRWVTLSLQRAGAEVTAVVRDRESSETIFRRHGIAARMERVDLEEPDALADLTRRLSPAIVFNLAGYGVDHGERDGNALFRMNAEVPRRLGAQLAAGQRLVHVGSALEYGPIGGDLDEASEADPDSLYGKAKLAGTNLLRAHCQASGLKAVTARLFTVYGPGEHEGRLLPALLEGARSGKPVALTAGLQKRDFVYVEDAAAALLHLGLADVAPGEAVNVGTGRLTSIREFAELAAGILGIPRENLRFAAIEQRLPEMEHEPLTLGRLRTLTGWQPSITIAEGISKTMEFRQ